MKILYLAHRIPFPPNKGDKIRSFHQIRYLARNHDVHLACLIDDKQDLAHIDSLKEYCRTVDVVYRDKSLAALMALKGVARREPLSVAAFFSRELKQKVDERLAAHRFDCIFVFSSAMATYVLDTVGTPRVMDFVDVDSDKWRLYSEYHGFPWSWIYKQEGERLARFEAKVARAFDHSLFVSPKEVNLFRKAVPDRPVSVIEVGIDLEFFETFAHRGCQTPL